MPFHLGIFYDKFDPVRPDQIRMCLEYLSRHRSGQVVLVLPESLSEAKASLQDRWQMLVAAASCSKQIIPHLLPSGFDPEDTDALIRYVRRKFSDGSPSLIDHGNITADQFVAMNSLSPSIEEYCRLKNLYGAVSPIKEASLWVDLLFDDLNPHRFSHTLSVARTAFKLAEKYGIDPIAAEEAGLLHDCAKCLSLQEMQLAVKHHGLEADSEMMSSPALLHSIAGAAVAQDKYGISDQDILDAISYHNTGCAGMSRLAMCVCLADYIEPNREPFPLLEEVRSVSEKSLGKALLLSLEGVAQHVSSKGKKLHPRTADTILWLKSLPDI